MKRKDRRAAGTAERTMAEAGYALALGDDHQRAGRHDEAARLFTRAIKLDPHSAEAHHRLGLLLMERDELDAAMIQLRRALALRPDHGAAAITLVLLLKQQGKPAQAAAAYERALAADPRIHELRRQLLDELATPWARPIELARAGIAFVKLNPAIAAATARAAAAWPCRLSASELCGPAGIGAIAGDPVLRFLLEACPICDIALERLLTSLRAAILALADNSDAPDDDIIALACALAGQCFINDYVLSADAAELLAAQNLRDRLVAALADRGPLAALWLPAVASYYPLHTLPDAERLLAMPWPDHIAALLTRQIAEPGEERVYRDTLPALTAIDDPTSLRVRQQYEENPYPRWLKPARAGPATTIDGYLRARFPHARYRDLGRGDDVDILIAGCGTGQQSIEAAQRFAGARVLAVDLSRASLAYARRQSRACGLASIDYAQADIMNLPAPARCQAEWSPVSRPDSAPIQDSRARSDAKPVSTFAERALGRRFGLIEASGVLHHLGDPMEGWRRLLALLRPGGVMRLGFYSELARQSIVAVRHYVAAQGYGDRPDDIRRCRQDLMAAADGTPLKAVTAWPDFFTTSECRDLLFHVMEHRLTLPAIKAFLADNDLEFLGFEIDTLVLRRYGHRFPGDIAMADLDNWHQFEQRHPATFAAMYQFWVQRRS